MGSCMLREFFPPFRPSQRNAIPKHPCQKVRPTVSNISKRCIRYSIYMTRVNGSDRLGNMSYGLNRSGTGMSCDSAVGESKLP